jgi:mRNA interferase MazF
VSRHDPDAPRALTLYVPLTTQHRGNQYEIPVGQLPFLDAASVVNVQGLGSLIEPRLERKLGQLPSDLMAKVKDALRFTLEL